MLRRSKRCIGQVIFFCTASALFSPGAALQGQEVVQEAIKPDTSQRGELAVDSLITVSSEPAGSAFRNLENKAFGVGERLVFDIAWGPIVAGHAVMAIPDTVWMHGRPCYHIVTTAKSTHFFDIFHRVRDKVESVIDIAGLFPWRFEKKLEEGKYRGYQIIEFDQIQNRAIMNRKDTLAVPEYTQGILSSFYYVRTLKLEVGKSLELDNYGDGRIYPLRILVHRKQRIRVPAGRFDCVVVEPVMRTEGIFNQKGKMTIWLTDDERRIPVLMKSKIAVGSIDARLRKIESSQLK